MTVVAITSEDELKVLHVNVEVADRPWFDVVESEIDQRAEERVVAFTDQLLIDDVYGAVLVEVSLEREHEH